MQRCEEEYWVAPRRKTPQLLARSRIPNGDCRLYHRQEHWHRVTRYRGLIRRKLKNQQVTLTMSSSYISEPVRCPQS